MHPLVGKRISMLRIILILSVVFLHLGAPLVQELDRADVLQLLQFFFQDQLGRIAVPTLSMISGYLLFAASLDRTPLTLYRKKARTLLVPFLVFNVAYFALQYAIEYATGWAPLYSITNKTAPQLLNLAFGYADNPLNFALHFLRDLFVLILLAPLFGILIRRLPTIGLMLVFTVFMSDLDGHLVNRNTMAVLFYVGGMAAVWRWDLLKFDRFAPYCLAGLVAVCAAMIHSHTESYVYVYLVSPFLVWPAAALLAGTRIGDWALRHSKYSFFLFLAHVPLIRVAQLLHGKMAWLPQWAYLALGLVLIPLFLFRIYDAANHLMPGTFAFLTGGRNKKDGASAAPQRLPVADPLSDDEPTLAA